MISTQVVKDFADLIPIKDSWNELVRRSVTSTPFQLFEWHSSWIKAFGTKHELFIILVRRGAELVGVAPLMISKKRMNLISERALCFIGAENYASDYADFIVADGDHEALAAMIDTITKNLRGWSAICLTNIPERSAHISTLVKLIGRSAHTNLEVCGRCPAIDLSDSTAARKLARKESLRRHYNYFTKNGVLKFQQLTASAEILPYLFAFFSQHIARREAAHDKSQFLETSQQQFYRNLVLEMPSSTIRFAVVLFNNAPIAFHFGFEMNRIFYWYKPTFDPHYSKHGPGDVLLKFLIEHAIDDGLREFDFTFGNEPFKYRFSNVERKNLRVVSHRRLLSRAAAATKRSIFRHLTRSSDLTSCSK